MNCAYRCTKSGAAVDGDIATLPITTTPTHVQLVTTALSGKVVDVQPDVVAHRHNKEVLMVQPIGVLDVVVVVGIVLYRIGVPRISHAINPGPMSV